ncbi:membrane progestin receptor gamma-B-like protein [Amazona aestiva]|uniref:Membrane progestin receptor gamma-B-like protein n=1 Tax=Amazona aestiva TaxID=12930 RepID=A0A0Q3PU82_AMAAE|nr:membrane progestin receptor gamma-B-like protein [Amazona aestiva]
MLSIKLPRLLSINQVPKGYQEQGILFGYRPPRSSAADCLLSVFQMTNETLNIWTHFVPAWFLEAERPLFSKASRILAFAYPYLFDSIPLFYRFYLCMAESCTEAAIPVHYKHTAFAFLTCFIFASHLPERLAPGHFDYIGHSHQVFHVCGIIGTHFQMEAIMMDMAERHDRLLPSSLLPSSLQTLGSMGICMAMNLAVIGLCSASLRFMPEPLQREKPHRH